MEELREKLHKAIEKYGIGDERTIDISKELDEVICREQKGFLRNNGLNPREFLVERAAPESYVFYINTKVLWNFRR